MTELEITVEALKRCVNPKTLAKAMAEVRNAPPARKREVHPAELRANIQNLLIRIGVPASVGGFRFLTTGIELMVEDPDLAHHVTKGLYPAVGELYGTDWRKVERGIRHAIEIAFERGDADELRAVFGGTIHPQKGKVTNAAFLSVTAMFVRQELGLNK